MMELPLLRPEDDQAGVYVAVSGVEGWSGATLWRSENGVDFANQASFTMPAVAGIAATVLPAQSSMYMDRASSVRVQLLQGTLASCSLDDLMNGANAALLGGEIIQFQNATLIESGLYELTNLLRGLRGTESATLTHSIGEAFVMLTAASVQFLPAQPTDRGKLYHFRAVSNGSSLDFA